MDVHNRPKAEENEREERKRTVKEQYLDCRMGVELREGYRECGGWQ